MQPYFHQLNLVRFLLAIGVVLFHFGTDYPPFNTGPLNTLITHSAFRVSFFFFISGFVMTLVYNGRKVSPSGFYMKRATRILPMYLTAFVATLLLVVCVIDAVPKGLVVIVHGLLLQSWYPGYVLDLNFPAWSISAEMFFYLIFPFLLQATSQLSAKRIVLLTMLVYVLQSVQHVLFVQMVYDGTKATQEFIDSFPLWHAPTFFCGMMLALILMRTGDSARYRIFPLILLVAGLSLLLLAVMTENPLRPYIHNGLLCPIFAMIVTGLFLDRSVVARLMSSRFVSGTGLLSYGIFILQYPLWLAMGAVFGPQRSSAYYFIFYLAVLLLVSFLAYRYFEKPLLSKLRRNMHAKV